tara:strand:+ start:2960 stop:3640 length:681 start_codon:yes stop_codon:yes gene_type:complete
MLKCKNNNTSLSPEGLGWCAQNEIEGKIRIGKDKNKWIIQKNKKGIFKWIQLKLLHDTYKIYYPRDVYENKYICYIKNKNVYVYLDLPNELKQIGSYKIKKVFFGKDIYDKNKEINTILLELPNLEYIFIGGTVYKFKTNEKIIKYFSNTIAGKIYPQPIGLSKDNVYFLEPGDSMYYIPKKFFPKNTTNNDYSNAYDLFIYNIDTEKTLDKNTKFYKLKRYKSIN